MLNKCGLQQPQFSPFSVTHCSSLPSKLDARYSQTTVGNEFFHLTRMSGDETSECKNCWEKFGCCLQTPKAKYNSLSRRFSSVQNCPMASRLKVKYKVLLQRLIISHHSLRSSSTNPSTTAIQSPWNSFNALNKLSLYFLHTGLDCPSLREPNVIFSERHCMIILHKYTEDRSPSPHPKACSHSISFYLSYPSLLFYSMIIGTLFYSFIAEPQ